MEGFSVGGSTVAKSEAHTMGGMFGGDFFLNVFPLFMLVEHLEMFWPSMLSYIGAVISFMQPIAFVCNIRWGWGGLMKSLSEAVYIFLLPFWDPMYVHSWGNTGGMAVFWAAVSLVAATSLLFIVLFKEGGEDMSGGKLMFLMKCTSHGIALLLVPLLCFVMSGMVCNEQDEIWLIPNLSCWSILHIFHVIGGSIACILFVLIALTMRTMVYMQNPFSLHIFARPHSILDAVTTAYDVSTTILYFTLLASDRKQVFACIHAITSVVLGCLFALMQPYYSRSTTILRSASYFVAAGMAAFAASPHEQVTNRDADVPMVFVIVIASWLLALVLVKKSRAPHAYSSSVDQVRKGISGPITATMFPDRLPWQDILFGRFRNIDDILKGVNHNITRSESADFSALDQKYTPIITVPAISSIFFPTDIELACRMLLDYSYGFNIRPPRTVVPYYCRIYTKGLRKFPTSDIVGLHFIMFLHYFCEEYTKALQELKKRQMAENSVTVSYKLFRLAAELKGILNIRDNSHHKVLLRARKLHGQALGYMTLFWSKLLSGTDNLDLAFLVDMITDKRAEGLTTFESAIATRFDKGIGMQYAQFLEQVMLDETNAQMVRGALRDTGDSQDAMTKSSETAAVQLSQVQQQAKAPRQSSKTISSLSYKMNVMFMMFFVIVFSFGAFELVMSNIKTNFIDSLSAAGELRALAQYNGYMSLSLVKKAQEELVLDTSCSNVVCGSRGAIGTNGECATAQVFPKSLELREKLRTTTATFRSRYNMLTHGKYKMSYGPLLDLYESPNQIYEFFYNAKEHQERLTGLWDFSNTFIASLETLIEIEPACLGASTAHSFIKENTHANFGQALNSSLTLYEEQFKEILDAGVVVNIALFAASVCLVFLVYMMLDLSFLAIASTKMETLNLFSLIPKNTLMEIHADSKSKSVNFEICETRQDMSEDQISEFEANEVQAVKIGDESTVSGAFKVFLKNAEKGDGKVIKHTLKGEDCSDDKKPDHRKVQELDIIEQVDDDDDDEPLIMSSKTNEAIPWAMRIILVVCSVAMFGMHFQTLNEFDAIESKLSMQEVVVETHREMLFIAIEIQEHSRRYILQCDAPALSKYLNHETENTLGQHLERLVHEHDNAHVSKYLAIRKHRKLLTEIETTAMEHIKPICDHLNLSKPWQDIYIKPTFTISPNVSKSEITQLRIDAAKELKTKEYLDTTKKLDDLLTSIELPGQTYSVATILLFCLIGLTSVAMISLLPLIYYTKSMKLQILLKLSAISVVVVFVVLIQMSSVIVDIEDTTDMLQEEFRTSTDAALAVVSSQRAASAATSLNTDVVSKYNKIKNNPDLFFKPYEALLTLNSKAFTKHTALDHYASLIKQEMIAITIACDAGNLYTTPEYDELTWNASEDPLHVHMYTTRAADLALPFHDKMNLVMNLLYDKQYQDAYHESLNEINWFAHTVSKHVGDKKHSIHDKLLIYKQLLMAFLSLILGIVTIYNISFITALIKNKDHISSGKNKGRDPDALFTDLTRRVRISLALVSVLMISLFTVEIVYLTNGKGVAPRLNEASTRVWLASGSMFSALMYRNAEQDETAAAYKVLHNAVMTSRRESNKLYFGDPGEVGYGAVMRSESILDRIFGGSSTASYRMMCSTEDPAFSDSGVDVEIRRFNALLLELHTEADTQALMSTLEYLLGIVEASTKSFEDEAKDEVAAQRFTILVILIITALLLLVECLFIFRPMASKLLKQEEGTKLMLKMIPERERKTVGAIVQYLETGQIQTNKKLAEVNEIVAKMSAVPTIVVDPMGAVLGFSSAAEEVFGWTEKETLKKNVKMFMPDEYAKYHDYYLSRYRRTGVKRIIGSSRNAKAIKKDKTIFPVNVTVREIRQGKKSIYIGLLTDITLDIETERVNRLNNATSRAGTTPVICIDEVGTIIRWNRAAQATFGYTSREILKHNVKMLMKPEIQEVHDSYLERYARTGTGTIVGTGKKITQLAVRKGGVVFPMELQIEDVKLTDSVTIFIGNARDITNEFLLNQQVVIHENIITCSPVPLIVISTTGVIQKFSPASEKELGWTEQEAVGKNIKLIQTPEVAAKHNQYLSTYMKTGIKKVLGTQMEVVVKRKDGSTYQGCLSPGEAVPNDGVHDTVFIAHVENLREKKQHDDLLNQAMMTASMSPVPLLVISTTGIIMSFSPAAEEALGYHSSEVIGKNIKMLQPASIAVQHDQYLKTYLETGVRHVIGTTRQTTAKRKNGTEFSAVLKIGEVKSQYGHQFFGYITDISGEEEMKRIVNMGNAISSLVPVPFVIINWSGQIRKFSSAAEHQFGYNADDITWRNVSMLMPDEISEQHNEYIANYRRTGVAKVLNTRVAVTAVKSDGCPFPADLMVTEFKQNTTSFFLGFIQDTTEKIKYSVESEAAKRILSMSTSGVIIINTAGCIQEVSISVASIFQYPDDYKFVGKQVNMLMPDTVAQHHDGYLKKYAKTGIKTVMGKVLETNGKRSDGSEFPAAIAIREQSVTNKLGVQSVFYIGYVIDSSEQYVIEQANKLNGVIKEMVIFPLISITITGKILSFNQAAEDCFGYTMAECIGKNIKMIMPEQIAVKHDGFLAAYRKTGIKHVINSTRVAEGKKKNGSVFPMEIGVKEVVKEEETTFYGNIRDISEQCKMEFEKQKVESIISISSFPVLAMDAKGTVTVYNKAATDFFDYTKDEVIGQNIKMLQPPEIAEKHDGYLKAYQKTRAATVVGSVREVTARSKTGTLMPISLMVDVIHTGDTYSFIGFARDLSIELEFQKQVLLSNTLLEALVLPTIRINHVGDIQAVSTAVYRTFGWTPELIGQNIKVLQTQDIADKHDGYLETYLRTRVPHVLNTTRNVPAKHKDGSLMKVEVSAKVVETNDPKRPNFVGYLRDLNTEIQVAKSQTILNEIINMCPVGLVQIDDRGEIKMVNLATELLFGYSMSEMLGKNVKMIQPKEVADNHDEYLAAYQRTGVAKLLGTERLVSGVTKKGKEVQIFIKVEKVTVGLAGMVFVAFLNDATEQLNAERAAKISGVALGAMPYPCVMINTEGIVQGTSTAFQRVYKIPNPVGININQIMTPEIAEKHNDILENYLRTGKKKVIDSVQRLSSITSTGDIVPVDLWVKELKAGKDRGYVGYIKDLRSDMEASEYTDLMGKISSVTPVALMCINTEGIFVKCNQKSIELSGLSEEQLLGENVKIIMPEPYRSEHDGYLKNYKETGVAKLMGRAEPARVQMLNNKTGGKIHLDIVIRQVERVLEEPVYIASLTDATQLLESEFASVLNAGIQDSCREAIVVINWKCEILRFSKNATKLFGLSEEETIGKNVNMLMPEETAMKHDSFINNYFEV